ncbi:HNH endonuclease [Falsirhodobacter xinxiangensis]|uniref:HNH endonuclease n=1 Tax=Falsirhodobacter xinxiangensis TaxID=2530049 RepID=UPI0010AB0135|nr:HNH endonuclease signature motif containing protein [Rhodobacter xinxiangensis]
MVKISTIKPVIKIIAPRIGRMPAGEAARHRERDEALHWRKWYKTSRWQKLRWSILVRDGFTCGMCGRLEGQTSQLVADHKTPHRGNEAMFWDADNIWCVCKGCHDGAKQRMERRKL